MSDSRTIGRSDGEQLRGNSVTLLLRLFPIPNLKRDNANKKNTEHIQEKNTNKLKKIRRHIQNRNTIY